MEAIDTKMAVTQPDCIVEKPAKAHAANLKTIERAAKAGALCLMECQLVATGETVAALCYCPLPWQKSGLQETASGYGAKLTSVYKIHYEGKLRRIYHTCYGNASSAWFKVLGRTIFVN